MKHTDNYKLKKPDITDNYNIQNDNDNMDAIDVALHENKEALESQAMDFDAFKTDTVSQLENTEQEVQRLDDEKAGKTEVNSLAVEKADITYVNDLVVSVSNGTPEAFANLAAITAAYPLGDDHVKLNLEYGYVYKWDGSAWVQGWAYQSTIPTDFVATNIIKNGNFVNNDDWLASSTGTTLTISDNAAYLVGTAPSGALRQNISLIKERKYYVAAVVKSLSSGTRITLFNGTSFIDGKAHSGSNLYEHLSSLIETDVSSSTAQFQVRGGITNGIYVQRVIIVDLTAVFGIGNEPNIVEFETLLDEYRNGWFDGTVSPFVDNQGLLATTKQLNNEIISVRNEVDIPVTNIILNGDFIAGDSSWLASGADTDLTVDNGVAYIIGTLSNGGLRQNISLVAGRKYYVSALTKSLSASTRITLYDGVRFLEGMNHSGGDNYEQLASIITVNESTAAGQFQVRGGITNGIYVKYVMIVDLTDVFGAGNEPSAEEFTDILSYKYDNGWFNGEVNPLLSNRETISYFAQRVPGVQPSQSLENVGYIQNPLVSEWTGQAMITLSYDDGLLSNYRLALPLHEKHGIPATFNVIGERVVDTSYHDRFFDSTIVSTCHEKGIEIASHGYHHRVHMTDQTDVEVHYEMSQSKAVLENVIGESVDTIAIPFSFYDARVRGIALEYYKGVRVSGGVLNDIPPTDRYEINSAIAVTNNTTFANLKSVIDAAISQKKWCVIMLHGIKNGEDKKTYEITPQLLDQTLTYIRVQGRDRLLPVNTKTALKFMFGEEY